MDHSFVLSTDSSLVWITCGRTQHPAKIVQEVDADKVLVEWASNGTTSVVLKADMNDDTGGRSRRRKVQQELQSNDVGASREETSSQELPPECATAVARKNSKKGTKKTRSDSYLNARVHKFFPGYGWFYGTVASKSSRGFRIVYDDEDEEDVTLKQLEKMLVQNEKGKKAVGEKNGKDFHASKERHVTGRQDEQEANGVCDDKEPEVEDEEDFELAAESGKDSDLEYNPKPSKNPSTPRKRLTKQATMVTPSPSGKTKKTSSPGKSSTYSTYNNDLPPGSLAEWGRTGLQVRVLQGYLTLVPDRCFADYEFACVRLRSAGLAKEAYRVCISWDGRTGITGTVELYESNLKMPDANSLLWTVIEVDDRKMLPLLVGAPISLVGAAVTTTETPGDAAPRVSGHDLLPRLSKRNIKMSTSLLEKSIRRGNVCSPGPLLDGLRQLLSNTAPPGSTLAALRIVWSAMLVDGSPLKETKDSLGLGGLCLLSLVARADPEWKLPKILEMALVRTALRVTMTASRPWLGFVVRDDNWVALEGDNGLRDVLRATLSAVGGKVVWGKWGRFDGDPSAAAVLSVLNNQWPDGAELQSPSVHPIEEECLELWSSGLLYTPPQGKIRKLDEEVRLAALDPGVLPASLVLLQALLPYPPKQWKKHSLPALSRQVRKLFSEVNPRFQQRVQLARMTAWGKQKKSSEQGPGMKSMTTDTINISSFREVITATGNLSEQEIELMDCFESIQRYWASRSTVKDAPDTLKDDAQFPKFVTKRTGSLSEFDGRVAFLLAFGKAVEVKANGEVVSAFFGGDPEEPLLVQRIGKARQEGKELATAGGSSCGAMAVPSLGYVQRNRSEEERLLMEAAEVAVAAYWKDSKSFPLPLPQVGFQWEIGDCSEMKVKRSAALLVDTSGKKRWSFTVADMNVAAFDARCIVSPCMLDPDNEPTTLTSERRCLLEKAFYVTNATGAQTLEIMQNLHSMSTSDRTNGTNEGLVYDWIPLAQAGAMSSRTWRDILLSIRTRETDYVHLGRGLRSDGTGAPRDMTEGVILRAFHGLEMLYPTVLRKDGPLKFTVRPRGAGYYNLLLSLERLGRGDDHSLDIVAVSEQRAKRPRSSYLAHDHGRAGKRPRRQAAMTSSTRTRRLMKIDGIPSPTKSVRTRAPRRKDSDDDFVVSGDESSSSQELDNCNVTSVDSEFMESVDHLPLPSIRTALWSHQRASVDKIVQGVKDGKRGHADASAVGAGKTLTALGTIVRLSEHLEEIGQTRSGVLILLPTKALIKEWLLEVATHTSGFHVIEQRESGELFSLTYGKQHPPIDGNSLVLSTLDRVCRHPFLRQSSWDFVVVDECLAVQNADAKRNPAAWRQVEVSACGVLMLSATFFRSKYNSLFYMIRMLRSPLPREMEFLPATIHEHIVCQIPETNRTWEMKSELVPLKPADLKNYRRIIDAFRRKQINESRSVDGRKLWVDLESFLREAYEGRSIGTTYQNSSVMGDAFARVSVRLLKKGRRPLIFADTAQEAEFVERVLRSKGVDVRTWASIASEQMANASKSQARENWVIIAVKTVEGQGINMQRFADAIVCRPTPGDHLEQMKGRIDRPGQLQKDLLLVVLVAEHTIEEAKFSNIRLAGNFFREYIAPVAMKYRERVDLEATLSVGGTQKLKRGTVSSTWRKTLEASGQSGAFAEVKDVVETKIECNLKDGASDDNECTFDDRLGTSNAKKYKPLNKVKRNRGDPIAVREAKALAKKGLASMAVCRWLFPPPHAKTRGKGLPQFSLMRFSDKKSPVLNRETVEDALNHLSTNDPKLAAIIARVGVDGIMNDCGEALKVTQGRFCDKCVRSITFTMVSVDAGNAFLRRLAMKIGVCLEKKPRQYLRKALGITDVERLIGRLLNGDTSVEFSHQLLQELVSDCEVINGKRTGYPHLCGVTFPCGKNDDHSLFLAKARDHVNQGGAPVSAGYSNLKAGFLVSLVDDFACGRLCGERLSEASDREAMRILTGIKGIGDWCAGSVLMNFLCRADVMLYGDLTVRNYLNDLYDINHSDNSETYIESAADFADTATNRNLIDRLAEENHWAPYRSVVCFLMYHLQEENLVLV